jgi:membrane protease YdiL (CAAX protease family)
VSINRPRLVYAGLACGITWALVLPLVIQARAGVSLGVPAWWHAAGALGPFAAAWIVIRNVGGERGVGCWVTCLDHWRVSPVWWLVALLSPVVAFAGAIGLSSLVSDAPTWNDAALARAWADTDWRTQVLFAGTVAYGFLEEPGWRGFLLPSLRRSHGPLGATLRLWPIWALWHAPFFLYKFSMTGPMVAGWLVSLLAGAIILTWIAESSGSVLVVAVWHTVNNVAMIVGAVAAPVALAVDNVLLCLVAAGIAAYWWIVPRRAELDRRERARHVPDTPPMGSKAITTAR